MAMQLLANPSFEEPFSPAQWVDTSIGGATAQRIQGAVPPGTLPKAHTGEWFARLNAAAGQTAQITQTVLALLLPGSNLRLAFFARRTLDVITTVTATVDLTLFGILPLPGFVTISIPPGANPVPISSGVFEYYEAFSPPVPLGVTNATVTISVVGTGVVPVVANWDFDDVTLYNDVI